MQTSSWRTIDPNYQDGSQHPWQSTSAPRLYGTSINPPVKRDTHEWCSELESRIATVERKLAELERKSAYVSQHALTPESAQRLQQIMFDVCSKHAMQAANSNGGKEAAKWIAGIAADAVVEAVEQWLVDA